MYRILYLCESSCGGVASHLSVLLDGLSRRGHHVTLAYSELRADGCFRDALDMLASSSTVLSPMAIGTAPSFRDIAVLRRLIKLVDQYNPDLVHCHSTKAGLLGRVLARMIRRPVVYTPHAFLSMRSGGQSAFSRLAGKYEGAMARSTDLIITVSEVEREHALALGISDSKIRTIPNGIADFPGNPAILRGRLRRSLSIRNEEICIGTLARLEPQKNIANLLRSLAILRGRSATPFIAVIGGDGSMKEELVKLTAALGLSAVVRWPGEVNGREMMQAFDLYALSSDYEGMSVSALEAARLGLPIVTTAVGGAREIVEHGVNGLVVPAADSLKFAGALQSIIDYPEARERMSALSRLRSAPYSAEAMVDQTVDAYHAVMKKRAFGKGKTRLLEHRWDGQMASKTPDVGAAMSALRSSAAHSPDPERLAGTVTSAAD